MDYQAKFKAPFGMLGIRCDDEALLGIDFLPMDDAPQPPAGEMAVKVCQQLLGYLENPDFKFTLACKPRGTEHQRRVWQAMLEIPRGETRSYGELAKQLSSAAQAVGQACGANPIPIVIPCHRVVGKASIGGFMKHGDGAPLDIKRWLLAHERR